MAFISIMQGRLGPPEDSRFQSFPRHHWPNEFEQASIAGLNGIEWIYDEYGADANPLLNPAKWETAAALSKQHKVAVHSVCADYFMDHPILRQEGEEQNALLRQFIELIRRCGVIGMSRIVVPFVDISRIQSPDDAESLVRFIEAAVPTAVDAQVEIHLETDLAPAPFAALLDRLDYPVVKANYDSGNSASLGYDCRDEFAAYGSRIGSVHIKDRMVGGGTVPLGSGNADLPALFRELKAVQYSGHYVLQVARGEAGKETELAARNRIYVEKLLTDAGLQV